MIDFISEMCTKKNVYFLILFALFLFFFIKNPDVALMFFVAIIFACSLSPLVDRMSKKMSRGIASTIVLTGLLIVIALFIVPALLLGVYEIGSFAVEFPKYISNLNNMLSTSSFCKSLGIIHVDMQGIISYFSSSTTNIFGDIMSFIGSLSSAFLYIFTCVIFMYFFLADKQLVKGNFIKLFPSEIRGKTEEILTNISKKLGGYVVAQTLVSGSVWVTMTIGLLLFHIKYALLLGLIAGVLSIIPIVGSGISLIICLIACYEAGIKTLIIVTVLYTISHFIENHVVRPYIYSKFLSLHPIIVFLALLVGAKYAGVMGVIFAPPMAMALCILIEELYVKKMD